MNAPLPELIPDLALFPEQGIIILLPCPQGMGMLTLDDIDDPSINAVPLFSNVESLMQFIYTSENPDRFMYGIQLVPIAFDKLREVIKLIQSDSQPHPNKPNSIILGDDTEKNIYHFIS